MTKQQKWRTQIVAELDALQVASGDGSLSPDVILEWAASHPKSALHKTFEWDDTKAAREHRLWQARQLLQTYEVTPLEQPDRALVLVPLISVPGLRHVEDKGSYVSRDVVMGRKDYRQSVLNEQIKLLETMRANFGWLDELQPVWSAIDDMAGGVWRSKVG